jgi:hypothetical protein
MKSALHWDDPKTFLECLDDPKSLIYQEFRKACQESTAEELIQIMDELVQRDILAGNPVAGAYIRAVERIQKVMADKNERRNRRISKSTST